MEDYSKKIEAILFAAGRFVTSDELCKILGITNTDLIHHAIRTLRERLIHDDSPIYLMEEEESWKLSVGEQYQPIVTQVLPETELTKSELETLAVVAWKQPILQSEVIAVRTNKAYKHIDDLEERGFINKQKSGKTYQIKLTQKFYDYFNLSNHSSLKTILDERMSSKTISDTMFEGPYAGQISLESKASASEVLLPSELPEKFLQQVAIASEQKEPPSLQKASLEFLESESNSITGTEYNVNKSADQSEDYKQSEEVSELIIEEDVPSPKRENI